MQYKLENKYKSELEALLNRLCCMTVQAVIDLEMLFYPFRDSGVNKDSFAFRHSLEMTFERAILSIRKLIEPSKDRSKATLLSIKDIISEPDFYLIPEEETDLTNIIKNLPEPEYALKLVQKHINKFFQNHYGESLRDMCQRIISLFESQESLRIKDYRNYICHILKEKPETISFEIYDNLSYVLNNIIMFLSTLYDFVFDKRADFFQTASTISKLLSKDYWYTINEGSKTIDDKKQQREILSELLKGNFDYMENNHE